MIKPDSHTRIRALLEEGLPQTEIVKRLKVSKSTVSRVAIAMRKEHRDASTVVDDFVRSLGSHLEPDVAARCEALRVCAAKLDWSRTANTGTAAMAAPTSAPSRNSATPRRSRPCHPSAWLTTTPRATRRP